MFQVWTLYRRNCKGTSHNFARSISGRVVRSVGDILCIGTTTFLLEFESQLNTAANVLDLAVKSGCVSEQQKALHKLSKLMLIFREAGDDKSEITSQMLDNVRVQLCEYCFDGLLFQTEEHHQQLQLRAKELETPLPLEDVLNHNLLRHSSVLPVDTSADKNQYKRAGQSTAFFFLLSMASSFHLFG